MCPEQGKGEAGHSGRRSASKQGCGVRGQLGRAGPGYPGPSVLATECGGAGCRAAGRVSVSVWRCQV